MVDVHRLPGPVAQHWAWQLRAACRDLDNARFFHPERERGARRIERAEDAKAVCRGCPVIVECRHHALVTREQYGVWGGMTQEERRTAWSRGADRAMP